MNHRKLLTYIFILTITISIAHADLEPGDVDVHVEELTGEEVTYINPGVPKLVNLIFSFDRTAEFESISVSTSEMNPDSTVEEGFVQSQTDIQCDLNDSSYNCPIEPSELYLEGETSFNVTVSVENGGETDTDEKKISFSADTENPEVIEVSTEHCDEERCYLTPNFENTVEIKMSETPSGYRSSDLNVKVQYQGNTYPAFCEENKCEAPVEGFMCDDGEEGQMTVTGEDSAGNQVEEEKQVDVMCLASLPNVEDVEITPSNEDLGFTNVDPIEIKAVVRSPNSPVIDMEINATNLNGDVSKTSCEPREDSNKFDCEQSINPEVPETGSFDIPLTFTDAAGNRYEEVRNIEIAEVVEDIPQDEEGNTVEGDVWEMTGFESQVDTLNARNMYHDRRVPLTFTFEEDTGRDLNIADAEYNGECTNLYGDNNKSDIRDVTVIDTDEDEIYAIATIQGSGSVEDNKYEDHNNIDYECEMSITSREGNTIYGVQTISNVTFDFNLNVADHLTSNVVNEINRTENVIDGYESFLKGLKTSVILGESLCSMYGMAETGRAAWGFGHSALAVASKATGGAMEGAVQSSRSGLETYGKATEKIGSRFKPVCEFMACQMDWQRKVPEFLGNPGNVLGDMPDQLDTAVPGEGWGGALDPYKSEVIAIGTACLPAITNHVIERREIQCQYHNCLNKRVNNMGIPEGVCTAQKAQAQCVKTSKSIENALPGVSLVSYFRDRIAGIIGNPETALLSAAEMGFEQLCDNAGSASNEIWGVCQGREGYQRRSKLSDILFDISNNVIGRINSLSGTPRIGAGSQGGQQVPASSCEQMVRIENYADRRSDLFENREISEGELRNIADQTINPGTLVELDGVEGAVLIGASEVILSDKYYGKYPSSRNANSLQEIAWYHAQTGEFLGRGDKVSQNQDFPTISSEMRNDMKDVREEITNNLVGDAEVKAIEETDEVMQAIDSQEEQNAEAQRAQQQLIKIDKALENEDNPEKRQELQEKKEEYQQQAAQEVEPAEVEELDTGEIDMSEVEIQELKASEPSPGYGDYAKEFMDGVRGYSTFKHSIEALTGADLDFFNTRDLANEIRSYSPLAEAACDTRLNPHGFDGRADDSGASLEEEGGQDPIGTSSVFLTGMKQQVPDGYEYYISFAVNSPKENLDIRLVLENHLGTEIITQDVLNGEEVMTAPAGGSVGKTPEPAQIVREEEFDRVCIEFLPDGSLSDYFDSTDAITNNKFCQEVVKE